MRDVVEARVARSTRMHDDGLIRPLMRGPRTAGDRLVTEIGPVLSQIIPLLTCCHWESHVDTLNIKLDCYSSVVEGIRSRKSISLSATRDL